MRRLKIFAKGNVDVVESLHDCRVDGRLVWNGVNDVLRARNLGALIRLRHETSTGGRGLVHAPAAEGPLALCPQALEPFPLVMQASQEIFESDADAIVLSILADVAMRQHRSIQSGSYLFVNHPTLLDEASSDWLRRTHVLADLPTPEEAYENLLEAITRIRAHTRSPILIYNMSPIAPGPITHCFLGFEDGIAARVRRFNLMLIELSQQTGASIVDVESVVAKAGADRVKLDVNHLTGDGNRLVAEEVVRVLEDYGLFDN